MSRHATCYYTVQRYRHTRKRSAAMDDLEQRFVAIRQELNRLKAALASSTDEVERHNLHANINTSIRQSIQLIDQHLSRYDVLRPTHSESASTDQSAAERSVGGERV